MTDSELIQWAYEEDLPQGDPTTDNLLKKEARGYAFLVAKADVILSGSGLFSQCIHHISPNTQIKWFFQDSDALLKGQKVCSLYGNMLPLLKAERVALNFLGLLSGIATTTHIFVSTCDGTDLKILDTRKTIPGYRKWIKKAVVDGGGMNHRMNLSDAVLIKENHIRVAGSITKAVEQIRSHYSGSIEVEVSNPEEVKEAVELNVDRVLLDNMNNQQLKEVVELIPEHIEVEASGNMNLERVSAISKIKGIDFVSIGAITHSAPCADFSLLFEWPEFDI